VIIEVAISTAASFFNMVVPFSICFYLHAGPTPVLCTDRPGLSPPALNRL
jgi:hypothetical protein